MGHIPPHSVYPEVLQSTQRENPLHANPIAGTMQTSPRRTDESIDTVAKHSADQALRPHHLIARALLDTADLTQPPRGMHGNTLIAYHRLIGAYKAAQLLKTTPLLALRRQLADVFDEHIDDAVLNANDATSDKALVWRTTGAMAHVNAQKTVSMEKLAADLQAVDTQNQAQVLDRFYKPLQGVTLNGVRHSRDDGYILGYALAEKLRAPATIDSTKLFYSAALDELDHLHAMVPKLRRADWADFSQGFCAVLKRLPEGDVRHHTERIYAYIAGHHNPYSALVSKRAFAEALIQHNLAVPPGPIVRFAQAVEDQFTRERAETPERIFQNRAASSDLNSSNYPETQSDVADSEISDDEGAESAVTSEAEYSESDSDDRPILQWARPPVSDDAANKRPRAN